jgi:hypothetical protein
MLSLINKKKTFTSNFQTRPTPLKKNTCIHQSLAKCWGLGRKGTKKYTTRVITTDACIPSNYIATQPCTHSTIENCAENVKAVKYHDYEAACSWM